MTRSAEVDRPVPQPTAAAAGPGLAPPRRRGRWSGGIGFRSLGGVAALAVIVLIALPLLSLLAQAAFPDLFSVPPSATPSLAGVQSLMADNYTLSAGLDSFVLSAATAVVASVLGVGVAYLLVLTDVPAKPVLWGLTWMVFIAPSFLLAQGWELLLSPGGLASGALGGVLGNTLLSPFGVGWVLALKLWPFSTLAVVPALEGLGQDSVHASRLAGASMAATWRRILLPLMAPAIVAGALIIFAEVLSDFGVAATLAQTANFPLVTYSIYTAMEQFPVNFSEAAAASLFLVAAVGLAQWGQRATTGRRLYATRVGGGRTLAPIPLRRSRPWITAAVILLAVISFVIPAGATALSSFVASGAGGLDWAHGLGLGNYAAALHISYGFGAFVRSLVYAVAAATAGVLLGLVVTLAWRRGGGWLTAVLQALLTTTIAVPGIVLGAGYIFFWDQPFLNRIHLVLYGTPAALFLAYLAGGMPYSVRIATGAMLQIPESALSAARSSGAGLFTTLRRIIVPMLGDTWVRIWLMLFAGVMFELPVSQLLYPPGGPTIAIGIVHQFHNTLLGVAAALTVISTSVVALVAGLFFALLRSRTRARAGTRTAARGRVLADGGESYLHSVAQVAAGGDNA